MSTSSKPMVLSPKDWNTSENRYMAPKINDKGGKSITIISKQTNRAINLTTPLMMTFGISDFVDEKGESDGKYSISLNFPNADYESADTNVFLQKLKDFENQILDDAVKNSELWFGDTLGREVIKHMFFPILKYSKNKDTKKIDLTRAPSIRAKVPNYAGKWGLEIYDTQLNIIFPCANENMTPMDFVPKMSSVACVLGFSQLWVGGKGFGLQIKLVQCVVKPRLVESVFGKCHIQLSMDDRSKIEGQELPLATHIGEEEEGDDMPVAVAAAVVSTLVEDSDDEEVKAVEVLAASIPDTPVVEETPVVKKKMVIKKKV